MKKIRSIFCRNSFRCILALVAIIIGSLNNRVLNDVVFDYASYVLHSVDLLSEEEECPEHEISSFDMNVELEDDNLVRNAYAISCFDSQTASMDELYMDRHPSDTTLFHLPDRYTSHLKKYFSAQMLC